MSKRRRNRFWWPLVLLVLLPAGLYFAANWWLESAGARHLLERVLSDRAGMPVRMKGEFDLMLIPALGVSGTDLTVGEQADGTLFIGSAEFAVAVALKPLLQKTVQVEWIRLSGGR
ncbi:MAG: AsmA family protein, partial [Xanthomonadales bacterium]|nr:AsmA family protein [Xanthomonadales bacterium]